MISVRTDEPGTATADGPRRPWVVGVSGASGTPYARAVITALLAAGVPVDLVVSRAARLTLLDETGRPFRDAHWRDDLAGWLWPPSALAEPPRLASPSPQPAEREPAEREPAGPDLGRSDPAASSNPGNPSNAGNPSNPGSANSTVGDVRYWAPTDLAAGPASGSYPSRGMVVVPASTASIAGIALGLSKDLLQRAADVTLKERRPLVVVPRETPYTRSTLQHLLALHDAGATVLPASPAFYAGAQNVQQLVDFVAGKILDVLGVEHDLMLRWAGQIGAARRRVVPGDGD